VLEVVENEIVFGKSGVEMSAQRPANLSEANTDRIKTANYN
jgi:hypothetical protein